MNQSDSLVVRDDSPLSIAKVPDDHAAMLASWNENHLPAAASWDVASESGRLQLLKCFTSPDLDLATCVNAVWEVAKIAIIYDEGKVNTEGDTAMKWKACLIDPDDTILRFASPSAVGCLRKIVISKGGMAKVKFPFKVRIFDRPSWDVGRYFLLEEVP